MDIEKIGLCAWHRPMALKLAFLDGLDGALIGTSAAADADIGIDDELLFALRNSLNGALIGAGAALDASVGDTVSHGLTSICLL